MLHATLQINGRPIGWVEIQRRKDQVDPPSVDTMLIYDYKITITRSGGYDVHDGLLRHRYGDGAWALVALAIDAAGLWPLWNRREQEMAEIRRRNQKTIDRNLEILDENAVLRRQVVDLQAEVDQMRQWIEDHPLPISPQEQASIDAYEGNGA